MKILSLYSRYLLYTDNLKYKIHYLFTRKYKEMDIRLLIVLVPVLAAGSWALYNIGRAALQQLRSMGS
uniref:Photosystem II reaction center protein Y n=1 Tax=Batrachospermum sp. TaxID=31373 RepID=A0A8K1YUY2_9FLOR|nr:photosystem II protein Y [Batrachospermum sp.]